MPVQPSRRTARNRVRDWAAEQRAFLDAIAPQSHFHRAFDGLGDTLFFAKNLAGETLFFSRGILPHVGLTNEVQMLGATDEELTPGPFAAHYRAVDRIVIDTRKPSVGHVDVWFDELGMPDWYETNKYPIFDRTGKVIGVMGTLRACQGRMPPGAAGSRLAPALALLRADLMRFPPVARLAGACGMSPRHLQRSFHEIFSFSPRTYWMKCRIRAACEALRGAAEPILSISQRLGFCDQSNFTQHFRRHTGLTPSGYRSSGRTRASARSPRHRPSRGQRRNLRPPTSRSGKRPGPAPPPRISPPSRRQFDPLADDQQSRP